MLPDAITRTLAPSAANRLGALERIRAALGRHTSAQLFEAAHNEGVQASVYKPYTSTPASTVPLVERCPDGEAIVRALDEGAFDVWDASLDLLVALRDPDADPIAADVLLADYRVWPEIGRRAAEILKRSSSDVAFEGLTQALKQGVPVQVDLGALPHPKIGERLHEALRRSGALAFEPLAWPSVAAWDSLTKADQESFARAREEAARVAPRPEFVRALALPLGKLGYLPALPDLLAIWAGHPVARIRLAAAGALWSSDDPEVRRALSAAVDDASAYPTGINYVLSHLGDGAFGVLAGLLDPRRMKRPRARAVAQMLVQLLGDDARAGSPGGPPGPSRGWLRADPRWLDCAVALENDAELGAYRLLGFFSEEAVIAARARTAKAEEETPRAPNASSTSYFARYQQGDREKVYAELMAAGDLSQSPALRDEARAVAVETMTRLKHNLELLAQRLTAIGYSPTGAMLSPPDEGALAKLENDFGPLPLSLHAFYAIVGGVSFEGKSDGASATASRLADADPLVVFSAADAYGELEPHKRSAAKLGAGASRAPMQVIIAPDALGKARTSGGPAYAIRVPSGAADAPLLHERHGLPFVAYLRLCLAWGGFPDLERAQRKPRALIRRLTKDFLPI